jgi:hypothetical protein
MQEMDKQQHKHRISLLKYFLSSQHCIKLLFIILTDNWKTLRSLQLMTVRIRSAHTLRLTLGSISLAFRHYRTI